MLDRLGFGEFGFLVLAPAKLQAALEIPVQHATGFGVGDLLHRGVEGRLTEPLLENAGGIEEFVGDDGVEHAHAAFVEHTHDGFAFRELASHASAQFLIGGGERDALQVPDLALVVRDRAGS